MPMNDDPGARLEWPTEIVAEASSAPAHAAGGGDIWTSPSRHAAVEDHPVRERGRWPASGVLVALIIVLCALIGLRERIVRLAPTTAVAWRALGLPVNLAGLELRGVRARIEMDGARKFLITEGEIVNIRRDENRTTALTLAVRDSGGLQRYAWTAPAPKTRLAPGEVIAFRARLASPPEDGAEVVVRFARLDAAKK
jgi:hypothetical protein